MCVRGGEKKTTDIECDWRLVLDHSYMGTYSVKLLQLLVVMCLFLSMVVWQPFCQLALYHCACLRNARRISNMMHTCGLYISGTNKQQPFAIFPLIWTCQRDVLTSPLNFLNLTLFSLSCYQLRAMMSILCVCVYVCMKECRKRDEKATQRRVSIRGLSNPTQNLPLLRVFYS